MTDGPAASGSAPDRPAGHKGLDPAESLPLPQPPRGSIFLRRDSYRRRRLADAARLLPILAIGLFFLPLLWPSGAEGDEAIAMSTAISYVFLSWAGLIVIVALFGLLVRHTDLRYRASDDAADWESEG